MRYTPQQAALEETAAAAGVFPPSSSSRGERSAFSGRHNESEKRLPKSCLVVLCKFEPVLRWTKDCDNLLYQTLVDMLIPNVLRPIPSKSQSSEESAGDPARPPAHRRLCPPPQVP